ncbi:reverse transcriptase domain-containing protein [Tanacetum coccineum]|uniref:Reverse transcriptase domain-containing protein n=1 Tax=Tanacetum coccineum TaxID=301880 RepID=A0ABQ5EWF7_9ASTR
MVVNGGQRRRTIAGPPVNGGGQRRSAVADHRLTTVGPPVNHQSTVVDRQSRSGFVSGQKLPPLVTACCSMYAGIRSVVAKAILTGYYWPTMHVDARKMIRECQDCQLDLSRKDLARDNPFNDWCEKLCISQCFASGKHPQANDLVERANKSLGEGIKTRVDERSKDQIEEIPLVLWAHRTMIRTAEIDMVQNDEALEINFFLLGERREQAAIREARSKAKMEKYYNSKVHNTSFKPGDLVYRNNDASHARDSRKLGPKWEGPYEVTEALEKGPYKLRDHNGKLLPQTWNVATLKNVTCIKCKHPTHASFAAEGAVFKFLFSHVMSFN